MPRVTKPKGVTPRLVIAVDLPVRVRASLNAREHWAERGRRVKAEREGVYFGLRSLLGTYPPYLAGKPLRVEFTRLGGQKCDDDNLAGMFKGVRDEVASWLGRDDGHESLTWDYEQSPGGPVGIRILIATGNP